MPRLFCFSPCLTTPFLRVFPLLGITLLATFFVALLLPVMGLLPTGQAQVSAQPVGFTLPWQQLEAYAVRFVGPAAIPAWQGRTDVSPKAKAPGAFFKDERLEVSLGHLLPLDASAPTRLPHLVEGLNDNKMALHFGWRWHQKSWLMPEWTAGTLSATTRLGFVENKLQVNVLDSTLNVNNPGWANWPVQAVWPLVKGQVNQQLQAEMSKSMNQAAGPFLRFLPNSNAITITTSPQALSIEAPSTGLPFSWLMKR
jgi:hypothetical protein